MHDVLIVGLPMLMILAGILLNRADVKELRSEMRAELKDIKSGAADQLTGLRSELKDQASTVADQLSGLRAELKDMESSAADQLTGVRLDLKDRASSTADQFRQMRAEASERHGEVLARFNALEADMRQFYHLTVSWKLAWMRWKSVRRGPDGGAGRWARGGGRA